MTGGVSRLDDEDYPAVTMGQAAELLEVQPAGGTRMSWDAYVRGRPAIIGASIVG